LRFSFIVFDLDGTLIDSRRDIADAANALLVERGGAALAEEQIGDMVGDGAVTLLARAFAAARIEPPPDALQRFLAIYERHLLDHTRPYSGMREVLTRLAGRATLALLTNKPGRATRLVLDGLDLSRHFSPAMVVSGDGPFPRKPDPAGLEHLMNQTRCPPQSTLMVGDSLIDWKTARAAEASICLARYGFGYRGFSLNDLGPQDLVVDAPSDLLFLL
jgi:phosphoglycolate phosphatase